MRDFKLQRKCEHYWPEERETIRYGQIRVTTVTVQEFADFCISTFKVEKDVRVKPKMLNQNLLIFYQVTFS